MCNISIRWNLFIPVLFRVNVQNFGKLASGTRRDQVSNFVPLFKQSAAQIPNHTFGAAVFVHGNRRVVDEKNIHGGSAAIRSERMVSAVMVYLLILLRIAMNLSCHKRFCLAQP